MKPRQFDYVRPDTIDETVALLAEHGDEARILAGGQSLMAMMNLRLADPAMLIDIARIAELSHIRDLGDTIEVGAAVTQNTLLAWPDLKKKLPLLAVALPHVGHFQTRNKGTVCGSIAHADPSSEIPLSLAMLEGEVVLRGKRGERAEARIAQVSDRRGDNVEARLQRLCRDLVAIDDEGWGRFPAAVHLGNFPDSHSQIPVHRSYQVIS